MSKPAEIEAMVRACEAEFGARGHPGQQRRHPACGQCGGLPGRALGRHHRHQPVQSAFHTSRAGAPAHEEARNWGRIINIASAHGLVASAAKKSAYVAAKHGIVGFTKVAALETATTGITHNAICPGWCC